MFQQDFESGAARGLVSSASLSVSTDETGNHVYCNTLSSDYALVNFGETLWKNYAIEMRVKVLEHDAGSNFSISIRDTPPQARYTGSINYKDSKVYLVLTDPYRTLSEHFMLMDDNTWYTLRLEAAGDQINLYIDNWLVGTGIDSTLTHGAAYLYASANTHLCYDDIRVWALTDKGEIAKASKGTQVSLETVTDQAATGDGGNAWGGHQARIVRTQDGVFTAYTLEGSGPFQREWRLARRHDDGTWPVIAQGITGRDPVHLLAAPDGTLSIIGWPNSKGTIWSGKPDGDQIDMKPQAIPGMGGSIGPYSSAGTNSNGDICVLTSVGGEVPGGSFIWACYLAATKAWITHTTQLDYRYCYTYVFPGVDGSLSLVSNRDVRWSALQYTQPPSTFPYVFNAFGYWHTRSFSDLPPERLYNKVEKPTTDYPYADANAQQDAYIDTAGNIHIIYWLQGASTKGVQTTRHAVLTPDGVLTADVLLPTELGQYTRIFQDSQGFFYLLGSSGVLYPAGQDGLTLSGPIQIDLQGYGVEYSGFGIAVPRTGTPLGNALDVVFPSGGGKQWIYFQLPLDSK